LDVIGFSGEFNVREFKYALRKIFRDKKQDLGARSFSVRVSIKVTPRIS